MTGTTTDALSGAGDEPLGRLVREAVRFLPDTFRMFLGVVRDPRVPMSSKAQAAGLLALGLGPWDLLPVVGELELVAMAGLAASRLAKGAGEDVLREHWAGSDEGFRVVMALVDAGLRPRRLAWRVLRRLHPPEV
jgi:uncharacterized membrane protein YkvA (DUF1232 family)